MTTHTTHTEDRGRTRRVVVSMYIGLLLTAAATVAPYIDRATSHVLANHIHHGYPAYTPDRVDTAVITWLVILTVLGVFGMGGWAVTIWAVKAHKAWARPMAAVLFVTGTSLAFAALLTKDNSGEVGLAPLLGWIGMLPPLSGLVALVMLWTAPTTASRNRGDNS